MTGSFTEAGCTPPGLERGSAQHPGDSLLSDELAIHGNQPEVHLEKVLEHAQLLPQVPLALGVVSIDGNEQALSELQAQRSVGVSQPQGTPSPPRSLGTVRGAQIPGDFVKMQLLSSKRV